MIATAHVAIVTRQSTTSWTSSSIAPMTADPDGRHEQADGRGDERQQDALREELSDQSLRAARLTTGGRRSRAAARRPARP